MSKFFKGIITSILLGILLGLSGTAVAYASDATAPGETVTLSLEWLISGRHVGFYVALENGYYEDQGLDVTIKRGYGSGDTVKRVATGRAVFGIADTATL